MDPSNPESPPAAPPGSPVESMRPASAQLDDGVYFFLPLEGGTEWTEVRVTEGKLFRLVAIDEGIDLIAAPGSFAGPLQTPTLAFVKVH